MTIIYEIKKQLEQLTHFTEGWAVDYVVVDAKRILFASDGRVILNFNVRVALDSSKDEPNQDSSDM